jgi:protein-S-isoprenylcysteine O-methyltransferase Ste14
MATRRRSSKNQNLSTAGIVGLILAALFLLPWFLVQVENATGKKIVPDGMVRTIGTMAAFTIPVLIAAGGLILVFANPVLGAVLLSLALIGLALAWKGYSDRQKIKLDPNDGTVTG